MRRLDTTFLYSCFVLALAAFTPVDLWAQATLVLSSQADFSSTDHFFDAEDTIYIRADVPGIDVTAVEKSAFEIEPAGRGTGLTGMLTNNLDGTFTAAVPVATLEGEARAWRVKVDIEDEDDHSFEARSVVIIRGHSALPEVFHLRGAVEQASATEVVVAGRTLQITNETRIIIPGDPDPQAEELAGRQVFVLVAQRGDALVAISIVARGGHEGEIEVRGPVRLEADGRITVRGLTFTVDAATVITDDDGAPLTIADLAAGTFVEVRAQRVEDGWLATEIRVLGDRHDDEDDDREHEIVGPVEAVGDTYFVVNGLRIEVDAETEFDEIDGLADLAEGMIVEVEFRRNEDGTLVALKVEVEDADDDEDDREVEVRGIVTAIAESTVDVNGLTFVVDTETRIVGDDGVALTLAHLTTGMLVEVEGLRRDDGTLVALVIEVEADEVSTTAIRVRGVVTAATESTVTIGTTTFAVTEATEIRDRRGATLTLADIQVGMLAHAWLTAGTDGTLTALRIEVRDRFEQGNVVVIGLVRALSAAEITVGRTTFTLNADTKVYDRDGNEIGVAALVEGQVVRIEGQRQDDGTVLAIEIRVRSNGHREGAFYGPVTAVDADTVVVAGVRFVTSAHTLYHGVAGLAELQVGQAVKVHYRFQPDGTRLALRIAVPTDGAARVVLRGTIDAVEADTIVVAGVRVAVTEQTEIVDREGLAMAFADLAVGQTVRVYARVQGGVLEADRIAVREAVTVTAAIEARTENTIAIGGQTYLLSEETLVVGSNNTARSLADVQSGVFVEVLAVSGDETDDTAGSMTAERIQLMESGVQTGTDDPAAGDVPTWFELEQNYPNPFNPSTTIAFEIHEAGAVEASLVVYNVLGQQVRVLAAGLHAPGRHRYEWHGYDESGRAVASGVYLYRLQVRDRVATRTMTLVK